MLALHFDGTPELQDLPRPAPRPGEVLIQVHLAGVCRTDLEVLHGYHQFRGIMGHEFVGRVVGPEATPWLGRRVVGEINLSCDHCDLCRRGLARHCRARQVIGLKDRDGAFAEFLALPEANLHEVPPNLPDDVAVFTEPLAAALRVMEVAPFVPGGRVLVVGDGPLGLLTSWALAANGGKVDLVGHHVSHLALAQSPGIETFLEGDFTGRDYALAVEASGSPGGLSLALERVRPLGTVVLKSTYVGRYPLDPASLVVPEVRLVGCRCGPFPRALSLLEEGLVDPTSLIDRRLPLAQGPAALARAQSPGALKVLLDCQAV
jgi:threonine dehydrogenase-like Zn-dependent dehydrogenase